MSQKTFNEEMKRFHAQTFGRIGEDDPIFKSALSFYKKSLGLEYGEKVLLLFKAEAIAMQDQPCAYFEFVNKDENNPSLLVPASPTRDLYKWVHNGFPFEVLIHDPDPEKSDRYYLRVSDLEKIMTYASNEKVEFEIESAPISSANMQTSLTSAFDTPVKHTTSLDKPLSEVTLGEFIEALKSIK